ncbi:MAG TPA: DUF4087 domain-containing protein [Buttiauxella sp.]
MRKYLPLVVLILSGHSLASELRCGWLQNPSPANQWLIDKDGTWDISLQGHYSAPGIEKLKDYQDEQFVNTNGNYGYGCSCVRVDVSKKEKKITQIYSSKNLPLERCKTDKTLPAP